jgi:type IV pilus assembly protein PilQ
MKNYHCSLIASGAVFMLLMPEPAQALAPSIKGVKFVPHYQSISLKLKTADKRIHRSGFLIASRGKNLVVEIPRLGQPSIVAQLPSSQNSGVVVPNPEVIIQDNGAIDPSRGQPTAPAPPFLPRAVAPPVGDMAVSNIDTTPEMIDLGTTALVPRLVLREAPAREVLAVLARYAGLNIVFLDGQGVPSQPNGQGTPGQQGSSTVSLDLENEPVQDVFNSVLMVSGLHANRKGRTIFVSFKLPDAARNLISRAIRLNQVKAVNAATFLAGQGAGYQRVVVQYDEIVDPITQRVVRRVEQPAQLQPLAVTPPEGGFTSPLLLTGLTVSADERLNSITLIGEPRKVQLATSLLTQLDARRRQVAVNVKVIDINLDNTFRFGSSFSFGINDTGVINQNGIGIINFGTENGNLNGFPPFGSPNAGQITPFRTSASSNSVNSSVAGVLGAGSFNIARAFLAQLQSSIQNNNAKILTDPTLIVQEGQEATVKLVQNVLESVKTEVDPLSGVRTTTPVLAEVGLTLTVNIDRIDDNGFVGLSVSPTVSAPGSTINFESGDGATNQLNLIQQRALSSGLVRLRDSSTLVLSGIISEAEREVVSKIPILGDLPLIGSLFRSSSDQTVRGEVVILLTPHVIDEGSQFGYNYTPGKDAAEVLQKQGFPVQGNP